MKLFFLRHGEAEYHRDDDIRQLTEKGRHDVRRVANASRESLASVQHVLVSPIVRAQQTAEIACEEACIRVQRTTVDWLIHESPLREALMALAKLDGNVLLVGHQPLASKIVESLCDLHPGETDIGTANLIAMEGEAFIAGAMQLQHHTRPELS
ncbi:MAG TPA: phosphohistidine phosphatase SixA [Pseudomonadales bacterium]|nr:phosphohistidine phosphatase SixA [Pseudomonadales bacterium]